ncbi:MAG: hypothetical protein AB7H66_14325 [Hyphomonadaceae bacterium]
MADKKPGSGSPKQNDTQKKPATPGGGSQPVRVNPGFQGGGSGKGGGGKK